VVRGGIDLKIKIKGGQRFYNFVQILSIKGRFLGFVRGQEDRIESRIVLGISL
jgi:hypothetical protein